MLLITFLTSVVLALLVLLPYYILHMSSKARASFNIPCSKPWPLVGNILEFGFTPVEILRNITRLWREHGFIFRAWIGTFLYVVIADPKHAEHFLTSNINITKNINYKFLEPWLGTGLLTAKAKKWRHHRKILTPAFHFKILEQFIHVFNTNGDIFVEKLKENVGGPECDIYKYINLYTLDVICEAAMGVQLNVQSNKNSDYLFTVQRLSEIVMERSLSPWYFPRFIFNMSSLGKQHNKYIKVLHDTSYKIIKERKREVMNKKETVSTTREDDIGEKKRLAFLDLLLQYNKDGGYLTDEEIREEVDTFMFEGHDTTASGLSFCIWLLANNQHCQEKAYQEVYELFGDTDRDVTTEDLTNMKYLECVIKESLRLYPSVPFYLRELDEDVKIDEYEFLAGTTIMLAPIFMHRHPDYFPDPEKFDPDRFSADNSRERNPFAYVPFSAGPRNCIGQKFAMMEMKALISKVLRKYKIYPGSKEIVLSFEIILRAHGGIFVKLESRK